MNEEKIEALEKHTDEDGINDRRTKFSYFHTPDVPYERRKRKNDAVGKDNLTDSLTAIYWG